MKHFAVRAYDANRNLREFSRRVPSERDLRVQLTKEQLVIGDITPIENDIRGLDSAYSEVKAQFIEQLAFFKKNSVQSDVAAASLRRMFGTTPISIPEHLKIWLARISGGHRRSLRAALLEVIDAIPQTAMYSEALEKAPDVFSSDEITLLMISENKKSQMETFHAIAEQLHRDASQSSKVNAALWYPRLLAIAVVGSFGVYFKTILPILRRFFQDQHEQIIFPLNAMIAVADFMGNPLYASIAIVGAILIGLGFAIQVRNNRKLQYRLDLATMNLPLFGPIIKDKRMARMFYSLKLMTENGRERYALEAAIGTAQGPVFRDALVRAAKRRDSGEAGGVADALAQEDHLFDVVIIETLRTRERTASMPEIYGSLIGMLEERIDLHIYALPKKIESYAGMTFAAMIGAMAYLYLVPGSYAIAHVH